MAAVTTVRTNIENRMDQIFSGSPSTLSRTTKIYEAAKENSFLKKEPPGQTVAGQFSPGSIISEGATPYEPTTMQMTAGTRKIDGVVGEIMRDSVIIHCMLPSGNLDLRLPPVLVPAELMSFGAPVWVPLETTGGIRTPVIEPRPIKSQTRLDGQDAVEDWLNSA